MSKVLGSVSSKKGREVVKLSDTAKTILDSLKNTVVGYVCKNEANKEWCEKTLRRRLSYNTIIEALNDVVASDELLRLKFVGKALEHALSESVYIMSWKEAIDEEINKMEKTKSSEGRKDTSRVICDKNQDACKQLLDQSIDTLHRA
jgi:uncharacterized protein with von Willebrand factor type A (vWA) domain